MYRVHSQKDILVNGWLEKKERYALLLDRNGILFCKELCEKISIFYLDQNEVNYYKRRKIQINENRK
jgi:hypothetical protein